MPISRVWTKFLTVLAVTYACSSHENDEEPPPPQVDQSAQALSPVTISFQNGALPTSAYTGSTDTTLRQTTPTTNAGNDTPPAPPTATSPEGMSPAS
jgi:hypothetical protein